MGDKSSSTTMLGRRDYTITFLTGSFSFTNGDNAKKYAYEFTLLDTPTGVEMKESTSGKDFRTISVGENATDGATFSIQMKAYALDHQDAPCFGQARTFTIYNPAGKDITASLPGLKRVDLLVDGVPLEERALGVGKYTLSVQTEPVNYLSQFPSQIIYWLGVIGPSLYLTDNVLTITAACGDYANYAICFQISNTFGANTFETVLPIRFPHTQELNSYYFPGTKNILLSYEGHPMLRSLGGEYDIDVSYDTTATINDTDYFIKIDDPYQVEGVVFKYSSVLGPIHVTVPSTGFPYYSYDWFRVDLYSYDNPNQCISSSPFIICFAN